MNNINKYPTSLVQIHLACEKAENDGAKHKLLLDLGETFLKYLTGIMFGEYKNKEEILKKLETELYKRSGRSPSFGVYLSFLRHLTHAVEGSILADKFQKNKKYELASIFISEFELIKNNIDSGIDESFTRNIELKRKTSIGQKTLIEFYDQFIIIRNIYAHPEEKAGPKNKKRKWPLGDEYYEFINPLLQTALIEIINDFEILQQYKPVFTKALDDKNKKGKFILEIGKKETEFEKILSVEKLNSIITETRYLIDDQDEIYVKLFKSLPAVNAKVAGEIIHEEKAKMMEPHLLEIIHSKLIDDGRIDEMEYLVLNDTANSAFISTERLFELIDKKRKELHIEATIGTPENKGSLFIQIKDDIKKNGFNPWWLYYLSMVPKVNKQVVKDEKEKTNILIKNIENLKKSKKHLQLIKRVKSNKENIKAKKKSKSSLEKSTREKIIKKKNQIKKASNAERKEKCRNELLEIRNGFDVRINKFKSEIIELQENLVTNEKLLSEKITEIDKKIKIAEHELESFSMMTQWGMHKNLWNEINQYIEQIIQDNLNVKNSEELDENDGSTEEDALSWKNTPNSWQIGALAYTYWGKIYPHQAPLGRAYNIGYAVSNKFQWLPKRENIEESLINDLSKPATLVWTTTDDKWVAKIDLDGSITQKRVELNMALIEKYEKEFLSLGVNVRCHLSNKSIINEDIFDNEDSIMPLEKFLEEKGKYTASSIFSRIWPIDSFYNNGRVNLEAVAQYEREMTTLITIFSNSLITLNDYALEKGVNQDTIGERFEQFKRAKKALLTEVIKNHKMGLKFEPSKEEINQWRKFAKDNFDMTDYLFNDAFGDIRWTINSDDENLFKEESNTNL